jgi:hypothetical protein
VVVSQVSEIRRELSDKGIEPSVRRLDRGLVRASACPAGRVEAGEGDLALRGTCRGKRPSSSRPSPGIAPLGSPTAKRAAAAKHLGLIRIQLIRDAAACGPSSFSATSCRGRSRRHGARRAYAETYRRTTAAAAAPEPMRTIAAGTANCGPPVLISLGALVPPPACPCAVAAGANNSADTATTPIRNITLSTKRLL